MAKGADKRELYYQILKEIQKFHDPTVEQRLALILKKIWPNDKYAKQKLNHYLQRFIKLGLIRKVQSQPHAIYNVTVTGGAVKENLTISENTHKTVTWGYENLLVGYKILYWGSWKFRPLGHKTHIQMTNWSYQLVGAGNGLQAKVQSNGLLLISGPSKIYGPDGDELKMRAHAMVQDAARWFEDHYDMGLDQPEIRRPGEKYLPDSTTLCKILGNFKLGDYYVNASPPDGEPHLEEKDNSMALENILKTFQETPGRLENIEKKLDQETNSQVAEQQVNEFRSMLQGYLSQQVATSNAVNYIGTALKNQTEILGKLADRVNAINRVSEHTPGAQRGLDVNTGRRIPGEEGLAAFIGKPTIENIEIEITEETPKFSHVYRGAQRIVGPFSPGARIYLPVDVARQVISDGYARRTREDKARTG